MDVKEKTSMELYFGIREKLAAYTNGEIIRQAEVLIEELYRRLRELETNSPKNVDNEMCRRGVKPSQENCFACVYEDYCRVKVK